MREREVDVLIVGAGISGIGMAVHLQRECPDRSFAILEARPSIGGTWDLFRYPGIRSDSDMHTLGFVFEPWTEQKAIADGPSILAYLKRISAKYGLDQHTHVNSKVVSADWSSAAARWTVRTASGESWSARWLYMGSGYYDYDHGHDPEFPGREDFAGQVVHPQFWPEYLDYGGKNVVVIGSGATAVTLVPNLAKYAASVTMLQRTPTWYVSRPAEDRLANFSRKVLGDRLAYRFTRWRNVRLQHFFFKRARAKPDKVGDFLKNQVRKHLGGTMNEKDFTPPYGPWEQRLCLVPDADLFTAVREGRAEIVTDHIDRFDPTGVQLKSGRHLKADIIVTATGLKLAVAGKVAFSVDGLPTDFHRHFYYKGCLFSNIPNMALVFGYLNASWTLKADIVASYVCRVLNHMRESGADIAVPVLDAAEASEAEVVFDFSSGYIQRALDQLPVNGTRAPWKLDQDYLADRRLLMDGPVEDGVLAFRKAGAVAQEPMLEAAE